MIEPRPASENPTAARPASTAWLPVLAVAAFPLVAHLITAGNYGIFRDEYYYLACARHLAWGYVDQPPFSIAVLALVRSVLGEGILALRLVPALCGSALVVLVGYLAGRLGGGRFAQALAAVAMAIVGVAQVASGFYSMNAIDLVVWAAAWVLLAAWAADPAPRRMISLGALLGLGLLNKIGVLVFGAALTLALPLTPLRRALRTPAPYLGGALALLMLQHAKPYYAAGLFPLLFAAGACAWEGFTARGRLVWLRPVLLLLLIASGVFFLPLGMPVLPVETYARWQA